MHAYILVPALLYTKPFITIKNVENLSCLKSTYLEAPVCREHETVPLNQQEGQDFAQHDRQRSRDGNLHRQSPGLRTYSPLESSVP